MKSFNFSFITVGSFLLWVSILLSHVRVFFVTIEFRTNFHFQFVWMNRSLTQIIIIIVYIFLKKFVSLSNFIYIQYFELNIFIFYLLSMFLHSTRVPNYKHYVVGWIICFNSPNYILKHIQDPKRVLRVKKGSSFLCCFTSTYLEFYNKSLKWERRIIKLKHKFRKTHYNQNLINENCLLLHTGTIKLWEDALIAAEF